MSDVNQPESSVKPLSSAALFGPLVDVLEKYRCQFTTDEDENGLSLLDALSPMGSIAEGKEEIQLLADHIESEWTLLDVHAICDQRDAARASLEEGRAIVRELVEAIRRYEIDQDYDHDKPHAHRQMMRRAVEFIFDSLMVVSSLGLVSIDVRQPNNPPFSLLQQFSALLFLCPC